MADNNIMREAVFFFGAKTRDNLFLLDKIKAFEEKLNLKFIPTLSREESPEWKGERGRVPNAIDKYIDTGENYSAYLCGSPAMIDSIVEALVKRNVPVDKIYFDKF
jgi:Na+-transporting NADH:ubiquinone oxidoreductase subunit F